MESDSERQGLGALTCRVIVLIEQAFDCSWLAHVNQAAGLAHAEHLHEQASHL